MACAPCSKKGIIAPPVFVPKNVTVTPGGCPEPEYIKELEELLLCMTLNKYYVNSSMQEVNMLLGQIGTMRLSGNFCQYELSNFYNRLKQIQCPATPV